MSGVPAEEIRAFVLDRLVDPLRAKGLRPQDVPDDFDLFTEGVIDSLGVIEIITAVEEHFRLEIDLEDLDAEDLTIVGPFCGFIAQKSGGSS